MSQTPGGQPDQPATVRAEALLDNMGRRLGHFAALAGQRIQNAAASVREQAERASQPNVTPGQKPSLPTIGLTEEAGQRATVRAEEIVDRMAERLNHYASLVSLQVQKGGARMREEAEDMWAEAQDIRRENGRKPE